MVTIADCPEDELRRIIKVNVGNTDCSACQVFYNFKGGIGEEPFVRKHLPQYRGVFEQIMNGCPRLTRNTDGTYTWKGCEYAPKKE